LTESAIPPFSIKKERPIDNFSLLLSNSRIINLYATPLIQLISLSTRMQFLHPGLYAILTLRPLGNYFLSAWVKIFHSGSQRANFSLLVRAIFA